MANAYPHWEYLRGHGLGWQTRFSWTSVTSNRGYEPRLCRLVYICSFSSSAHCLLSVLNIKKWNNDICLTVFVNKPFLYICVKTISRQVLNASCRIFPSRATIKQFRPTKGQTQLMGFPAHKHRLPDFSYILIYSQERIQGGRGASGRFAPPPYQIYFFGNPPSNPPIIWKQEEKVRIEKKSSI